MKHVSYLFVVCLLARDVIGRQDLAFCYDASLSDCAAVLEEMRAEQAAEGFSLKRCVEEKGLPPVDSVEDYSGSVSAVTG